ncbi:MAG: DUF3352 domain-containing protein [Planctomycetes bacterium]|nr:DUF3352 domain-containing protein [Planctomycetota bacterium]
MRSAAWKLGRRAAVACALLVVLALLAVATAAQTAGSDAAPLTLEAIAPRDVFAFVSVAGLEEGSRAAEELQLLGLWQEPEVQQLLAGVIAAFTAAAEGAPPEAAWKYELVKRFFAGRMAAIAGGVTVVWARHGPVPVPGVVLALDLGDRRKDFELRLADLLEGLLPAPDPEHPRGGVVRSALCHRGQEILVLRRERGYPQLHVCGTRLENLLLVGLHPSLLQRCIDVHRDGGRNALCHLPSFRRARAKAEPGALVEAFLNMASLAQRFRGLLPDEWLGAVHDLGLDGLEAVYYASAVHDGDSLDTFYLDAPAPCRGLLAAGASSWSEAALRRVPRSAVAVVALRLDLGRCHDLLWQAATTLLPPRATGRLERGRARLEGTLGLEIRQDLLAAFGDEGVLYCELPRNGFIPGVVMMWEVRDRANAARVLEALFDAAGIRSREVSFGENPVRVVELPGGSLRPVLGFVGDRLVVALFPAGLRDAIRQHAEPGESVLDNPSFAHALGGLPWKNGSFVAFLDVKRLAAVVYNLVETFLPAASADVHFPFDPALVPGADVVLRHINGWAKVISHEEDGIVLKARSQSLATLIALVWRWLDRTSGSLEHGAEALKRLTEPRPRADGR